MSFTGEAHAGEEQFDLTLASTGQSAKGKPVTLENPRLELADPADSDKVTITVDSDPHSVHVAATAAMDTSAGPVTINVNALYDGRPGEGEVLLTDPGQLVFRSPDAATVGSVTVNVSPIP